MTLLEWLTKPEAERRAYMAERVSKLSDTQVAEEIVGFFETVGANAGGCTRAQVVAQLSRIVSDVRVAERLRVARQS